MIYILLKIFLTYLRKYHISINTSINDTDKFEKKELTKKRTFTLGIIGTIG